MWPAFWIWSPTLHLPLSGGVAQHIEPVTLFDQILPGAGKAEVERRAFDVASYGHQLGLITTLLLEATQALPLGPEGEGARKALQDIDQQIGRIKAQVRAEEARATRRGKPT